MTSKIFLLEFPHGYAQCPRQVIVWCGMTRKVILRKSPETMPQTNREIQGSGG